MPFSPLRTYWMIPKSNLNAYKRYADNKSKSFCIETIYAIFQPNLTASQFSQLKTAMFGFQVNIILPME